MSDEQAIRDLEIRAAAVMGWRYTIVDNYPGRHNTQMIPPGARVMPSESEPLGNVSFVRVETPPKFARDPAAILSALEWLRKNSHTEITGEHCYWHFMVSTKGSEFQKERLIGIFSDEVLGVVVCKAICAIGKTAEGTK